MFAKPASFKPFAAIKGSERKKTLQRIGEQLGTDPESDVLPKTVQSAKCILHSGAKAQVYSTDSHPLWVVVKDRLVPAVYLLHKKPDLVPTVYTVPNTQQFLQNGADFMTPGIFGDLPTAPAGSVVQIRSLTGPLLAVGIALVDIHLVKEGDKGKAVEVVNFVGDTLVPDLPDLPAPTAPQAEAEPQTEQLEAKLAAFNTEDEPLTVEEADDAFEYALRKVLSVTHTYPMASSTFAALLNENMPYSHPDLGIKRTSHKKMSKFLKSAEKQGLMVLKERQGDLVIISAEQAADNVPETKPAPKARKAESLEVQLYYRARSIAREVLDPAPLDKYYVASELRQMVNSYIAAHNLAQGAEVQVDENLRRALGLKQDVAVAKRDEVMTEFLKHCNMFHTIGDSKMLKGPIPRIEVSKERRGGNKVVTKVAGLEKFLLDPKTMAERLRIVCAGSTTVQESRTGPQVIVQGDHGAKIAKELAKEGIKPSWISV